MKISRMIMKIFNKKYENIEDCGLIDKMTLKNCIDQKLIMMKILMIIKEKCMIWNRKYNFKKILFQNNQNNN